MPGNLAGCVEGEECVLLDVGDVSREGGEGDRYILFRGGSLYWISPDVRRGYNDPGFDELSLLDDAIADGEDKANG